MLDLERRLSTPALVVLHHRVAKGATGEVEGDRECARILRANEREQHPREAVQGVRDETIGGREVGREREEGSKG